MAENQPINHDSPAVRTHVEIMQGVIQRMGQNSRSCKGAHALKAGRTRNSRRWIIGWTLNTMRRRARTWLRFDPRRWRRGRAIVSGTGTRDGSDGEVDLSHLAGDGVFKAWNDRACFEAVRITPYDAIAWSEDLELCPDALYMKLTGKALTDIMPNGGVGML